MSKNRQLHWNGCLNVRDLGGLRTAHGQETIWGAVVRSDSPSQLTDDGWRALQQHGICTIVDLRHDSERKADAERPVGEVQTIHVPLEDMSDEEFWQHWIKYNCTPMYYESFLQRSPQRVAAVFAAIGQARPGGVLVHCGIGRDRTGLIALLLLALVGVDHAQIVRDYGLSEHCLARHDEQSKINELLAKENTTASDVLRSLLGSLDVEQFLLDAGLAPSDIHSLRTRLVAPVS